MGIPRYFAGIIKKHRDIFTGQSGHKGHDYFFIDFNSMIYDTVKLLGPMKPNDYANYEQNLITETIKYLDQMIMLVNPNKLTFICVDGVPPVAKMKQQRARRYKGLVLERFKKSITTGKTTSKSWSTSAISPGTLFMNKLTFAMKGHYKDSKKVILNDHNIPGEGEHKIMRIIKDTLEENTDDSVVIYSPDADLIVLCMTTTKNKIYLLRMDSGTDKTDGNDTDIITHGYLDIDLCRQYFTEETGNLLDYSFMTFLCGNDFVTSSLFLKVKDKGLDTVIALYNQLKLDHNAERTDNANDADVGDFRLINSDYSINYESFTELVRALDAIENYKLKSIMFNVKRVKDTPLHPKETDPDKELERILNNFQHNEYYNPNHPLFDKFHKVFGSINYYNDNWVEKYNKFFFDTNNSEVIDDVCSEYMKSLEFCLKYYYTNDVDWHFYYKYRASPTFNDLSKWLEKNKNSGPREHTVPNVPLTQFEQLLIIMPKESLGLLPSYLRTLDAWSLKKNGQSFYPEKFILDIMHGHKYIYSDPILPDINVALVKEYVATTKKNTK